jgi:hypothetical protein
VEANSHRHNLFDGAAAVAGRFDPAVDDDDDEDTATLEE